MDLDIEHARAVLHVAMKFDAWEDEEGPDNVPEKQAIDDAQTILGHCSAAYNNGSRSPGILNMLAAAQVQAPAENPEFYDPVYEAHPEFKPDGAPALAASGNAFEADKPAAEPEPESEPAATSESQAMSIEDVFPGYDDMTAKQIKEAIVASAASGDLTEDEWERIKAYENENEERKGILSLEPVFKPKPAPPAPEPVSPDSPGVRAPEVSSGDYGSSDALEQAYTNGSLGTDRITQEGLFVPPQYTGDEPVISVDVTQISDPELTRLVMQFHSLEARTLLLQSQEEGRAEVARGLSNDAEASAYLTELGRLKEGLEKQTATAIDQAKSEAKHLAEVDDSVMVWRNRARRHNAEARNLKALAEGYEKSCSRLSREQSRRENLRKTPTS